LANFQRHARFELPLDPKITTIAGPSDVGKSSLLRALRWLALNNPQGDTFVREGSKGTTVQVRVDGHTITRKRGGSMNTYEVDGVELKAFGTGVPVSVTEILKLSETNFQDQHDAAYWLSLSSGEVSRQLNAVVDLGVIDTAFANVGSKIRAIQQRSAVLVERVREAKARRAGLSWAPEASQAYRAVEDAQELARGLRGRRGTLNTVVEAVRGLSSRLDRDRERYADLVRVGKACRAAVDAQARVKSLGRRIDAVAAAKAQALRQVPDIGPVEEAWATLAKARKRVAALRTLVTTAQNCLDALERRTKAHETLKDKIMAVGVVVCESCGQPVGRL
jgi:exonuclease SbcC